MIVLFDVGNSNIKLGIAENNEVKQMYRLKSEIHKTADEYYLVIRNLIPENEVEGVIISSVVPELTSILTTMSKDYFDVEPIIFGQGIKTGIMLKADNPREVGADLIADSVGATFYGDKVLVIDLGTASKFIYVENKVFKGCVITPGAQTSLNSLVSSTALLPKIQIKAPKKVLGNTHDHHQRRLQHHLRGCPIGLPLLFKGCWRCIAAAARLGPAAADTRHIRNGASVVDIGDLFLFLCHVMPHSADGRPRNGPRHTPGIRG